MGEPIFFKSVAPRYSSTLQQKGERTIIYCQQNLDLLSGKRRKKKAAKDADLKCQMHKVDIGEYGHECDEATLFEILKNIIKMIKEYMNSSRINFFSCSFPTLNLINHCV